jgi:zinc protease
LITRKTQGDKVWLVIENDYGTAETLNNRKNACTAASYLMGFGGGGLTRDVLSRRMEELKATWNLRLSGMSVEVPRKNLDKVFEILFLVWSEPLLPLNEFESYKSGLLASYESQLKSPVALADNATRLRFDNFPVGHWSKPKTYEEQMADAKNLSYEDVQRCAKDFANISHARVGIVGNLQERDVRALWSKVALTKASEMKYQRIADPAAPTGVDLTLIRVDKPDTPNARVLGVAVVPLSRQSKDFPALQLAVEVMGGNASSLIWKELREKDGLAYSTGMQVSGSMLDERTTIQLYATSASSQADKAMEKLKIVLQRVLDEGFTDADIARAKKTWVERRKVYLGRESNFASTLADALLDGYDFLARAKFDESIEQVTAKQATDVLRKYLLQAPMVWAVGQGR